MLPWILNSKHLYPTCQLKKSIFRVRYSIPTIICLCFCFTALLSARESNLILDQSVERVEYGAIIKLLQANRHIEKVCTV